MHFHDWLSCGLIYRFTNSQQKINQMTVNTTAVKLVLLMTLKVFNANRLIGYVVLICQWQSDKHATILNTYQGKKTSFKQKLRFAETSRKRARPYHGPARSFACPHENPPTRNQMNKVANDSTVNSFENCSHIAFLLNIRIRTLFAGNIFADLGRNSRLTSYIFNSTKVYRITLTKGTETHFISTAIFDMSSWFQENWKKESEHGHCVASCRYPLTQSTSALHKGCRNGHSTSSKGSLFGISESLPRAL
jgi:hypothetical protein